MQKGYWFQRGADWILFNRDAKIEVARIRYVNVFDLRAYYGCVWFDSHPYEDVFVKDSSLNKLQKICARLANVEVEERELVSDPTKVEIDARIYGQGSPPDKTPARLDPHGTEKPKTRIIHKVPNATYQGSMLGDPQYEDEKGERVPLNPKK